MSRRCGRRERRLLLTLLLAGDGRSPFGLSTTAGVSITFVFPILARLESAGAVESRFEGTEPPRRRLYKMTPSGRTWAAGRLDLDVP